jgi:hypothetical protein
MYLISENDDLSSRAMFLILAFSHDFAAFGTNFVIISSSLQFESKLYPGINR